MCFPAIFHGLHCWYIISITTDDNADVVDVIQLQKISSQHYVNTFLLAEVALEKIIFDGTGSAKFD